MSPRKVDFQPGGAYHHHLDTVNNEIHPFINLARLWQQKLQNLPNNGIANMPNNGIFVFHFPAMSLLV